MPRRSCCAGRPLCCQCGPCTTCHMQESGVCTSREKPSRPRGSEGPELGLFRESLLGLCKLSTNDPGGWLFYCFNLPRVMMGWVACVLMCYSHVNKVHRPSARVGLKLYLPLRQSGIVLPSRGLQGDLRTALHCPLQVLSRALVLRATMRCGSSFAISSWDGFCSPHSAPHGHSTVSSCPVSGVDNHPSLPWFPLLPPETAT